MTLPIERAAIPLSIEDLKQGETVVNRPVATAM
jgi:hypothetical protein